MKLAGASADILRQLAETPFLGRGELSPMTGWSNSEAYRVVDRLENLGLVGAVPHATELLPRTERYYVTAAGVEELVRLAGKPVEAVLRGYPVSSQWQNLLMERLDAVAAIYRVAVLIADWLPANAHEMVQGGRTRRIDHARRREDDRHHPPGSDE